VSFLKFYKIKIIQNIHDVLDNMKDFFSLFNPNIFTFRVRFVNGVEEGRVMLERIGECFKLLLL
jgi:hypothetical protein